MNDNSIRACFIVRDFKFGSALLRGRQVSEALAAQGHCSTVYTWDEFAANLQNTLAAYDVFVFVKEWSPSLAYCIRRKAGARIALDVLDNYDHHTHFSRNGEAALVDGFIAASTYHQLALRKLLHDSPAGSKPVWFIPHHHTNFEAQINDVARPVTHLGFQGDIRNRLPCSLEQELQTFCARRDLRWSTFYIHETQLAHPDLQPPEINVIIHQQLSALDIGIIFPPTETGDEESGYVWEYLLYKPATRLLNCLSHGLPTLCYPYVSYLEACAPFGYELFCREQPDLFAWLERLIADSDLRSAVSQQGQAIARHYALDRIVPLYVFYLHSLLL